MRRRFSELSRSAQWRYLRRLRLLHQTNDSHGIDDNQKPVAEENPRISDEMDTDDSNSHEFDDIVINIDDNNVLSHSNSVDDNDINMSDHESDNENGEYEVYYEANDEYVANHDDNNQVSDDEESEEDEDLLNVDDSFGRQPLYQGASLTVSESMILILSLVLKHNLNDTVLSDLLALIHFHCPPTSLYKMSPYRFKKFFQCQSNTHQKHFYCVQCKNTLSHAREMCNNCERHTDSHCFITLSIIEQLKLLMARVPFFNLLSHHPRRRDESDDNIGELYDGSLYSGIVNSGFLSNRNNLSLSWFTDGVPVFKSSKISIWPFYLRINELPFNIRIRRENTILAGLWFGQEKPMANLFGQLFQDVLELLYHGVEMDIPGIADPINIRAILLTGTCDLPAKSLFLNLTQFNGLHGCPSCEFKGDGFTLLSGKTIQVYEYQENFTRRMLIPTIVYSRIALQNKELRRYFINQTTAVYGVKGPCFLEVVMPDYIGGTAINAMHTIYQGVTKKLLHLWFDSSFSSEPFALRDVIDVIDKFLLDIKPPKFIHRPPCSINNASSWKASELKCWLLYYAVPILMGIMRTEYYQHFLLLVTGVSILSSDSVSLQQLQTAEVLLQEFIRKFQELYGLQFCSINIHLLLHLSEDVGTFGPLWVHTCFSYENINGQIIKEINGTTDIESQVAKSHCEILSFASKAAQLPNGPLRHFVFSSKKQVKVTELLDGCYSVGAYKKLDEQSAEWIELDAINRSRSSIRKYHRLLRYGLLFVSESYPRPLKHNSSFVKLVHNNSICYGKLKYMIKKVDASALKMSASVMVNILRWLI